MKLHYREYGSPRAGRPPLVLLHGLFGTGGNLHSIAKALETDYHVLVPDLPNHGRSPHTKDISFPVMAQALADWLDGLGVTEVWLAGHSMGGKTAWENIVCACLDCNVKKGGRPPWKAHMHLIHKPVKPKRSPVININLTDGRYRSWKQFLDHAYWSVELK